MRLTILFFIAVFTFSTYVNTLMAQGDGPRSFMLSPKGLVGLNPRYLNLNQNIVPAGNIYLIDADIKADLFPTTLFYNFSIGGQFAQAQFMLNPGSVSGTVTAQDGAITRGAENSGWSDGFAALRFGLVGAPALSIQEFMEHTPQFSLFGYTRVWFPGSYDTNKPLNLGTNRFTIEIGAPMAIPFGNNPKRPFWLETYPYFEFYTNNTDPSIIVSGQEISQKPLFGIENHLSHNFTTKFWASADVHYRLGGTTEVDGVDQDNRIHALGTGFTLGYDVFSFLNLSAGYGTILFGDNGIESDMFRVNLILVYANTKKQ